MKTGGATFRFDSPEVHSMMSSEKTEALVEILRLFLLQKNLKMDTSLSWMKLVMRHSDGATTRLECQSNRFPVGRGDIVASNVVK
jgi:hypothetical protein